MMEKEKIYNLYVTVEGTETEKYSEIVKLNDESKRGHNLMQNSSLEALDKMTSNFTSIQDLNEQLNELYNANKKIYATTIYCDEINENEEKGIFYTDNIVYAEDFVYLENKKEIEKWLIRYICQNPKEHIENFRVIPTIYASIKGHYENRTELFWIEKTVQKYIETMGYQGYREAYFTLKKLDPPKVEKTNEIHR